MAEYIKRETVINHLDACMDTIWKPEIVALKCFVEDVPAADVAPVVHGRWEYIPQTLNTLSQFRCPFCRWWSLDPSIDGAYNYCPNCGAKMDGAE